MIKIVIILLFFHSIAFASDSKNDYKIGKNWTKENTIYQLTYTAFQIIDWGQTKYIAKHDNFYENNVFLGRYPSEKKVDIYFGSTLFTHALISYILTDEYREAWQLIFIGMEIGAVANNFSMGVKLSF